MALMELAANLDRASAPKRKRLDLREATGQNECVTSSTPPAALLLKLTATGLALSGLIVCSFVPRRYHHLTDYSNRTGQQFAQLLSRDAERNKFFDEYEKRAVVLTNIGTGWLAVVGIVLVTSGVITYIHASRSAKPGR